MGSTDGHPARGTTCLLTILFVLVVAAALPARAAADVTATCTTPTATVVSCSTWFTTDVLVHWNVADCPDQTITADTPGDTLTCTSGDQSGAVTIKRDTLPPVVGAGQAARAADANGWYTRPVEIGFTGTDALSGIGLCPPVTFAGP